MKRWVLQLFAFLSYLTSAIFIYKGFHRMLVYEKWDSPFLENVYAYVGGDAYNYIINGTHATAFFVLATLFMLLGCFFVLLDYFEKRSQTEADEGKTF